MSLTKLEPPNFDLPIWSYEIYKTAQKLEFLNYPYELQPLPCGTWVSADPTGQRDENWGGGFDGAAMVELADGDSSCDTEDTYVIYVMRRVDWC